MRLVKALIIAVTFLAALALGALFGSACSQAQDAGWMTESLRSSCEWRTGRPCKMRPISRKRYYHHRFEPKPRVVYVERERDSVDRHVLRETDSRRPCKPEIIIAVSHSAVYANAPEAAKMAWRQMVVWKYGEMWMNFEAAKHTKIMCSSSETGERASDKGVNHTRCEARGIPCYGAEEVKK